MSDGAIENKDPGSMICADLFRHEAVLLGKGSLWDSESVSMLNIRRRTSFSAVDD